MRYLIVLLLAACAQEPEMAWYKGGSTEADFHADMGACRAQAFGVSGAMNNLMQVAMVQRACMEGKGWHMAPKR